MVTAVADTDKLAAQRTAYGTWAAQVKASGGVVTVLPDKSGVAAARYPRDVWEPKVNARQWNKPDAVTKNAARYGYYAADSAVQAAAAKLPDATKDEIARGAAALKNSWLDAAYALGRHAFWIVVLLLVVVGLYLVVKLKPART